MNGGGVMGGRSGSCNLYAELTIILSENLSENECDRGRL